MLVLTRKSNQSIMIGDEIEISVLSIMGEKVRIGIQAPRDIPVFRKEVYLEIQREGGEDAAAAAAPAETPTTPAEAERRPARRGRSAAARLAHHDVERLEHRDGDEHGGGGQQQHEHHEAQRAVLVLLLEAPRVRAGDGLAQQLLALEALGLGVLVERVLELGDALAQARRHRPLRIASRRS